MPSSPLYFRGHLIFAVAIFLVLSMILLQQASFVTGFSNPVFPNTFVIEKSSSHQEKMARQGTTKLNNNHVRIWIEEAEDGFVDNDENLEEGEVCLRAIKAFASNPDDGDEKRFLSAGALVQRPKRDNCLQLYDAWIADSIIDNGGPNLQKLGAVKIIDNLLLYHLQRQSNDRIKALRSFLVQCDDSSDFTCASYQAMLDRGFVPMRELLKQGKTIYQHDDYVDNEYNGDGNLFNYTFGMERYEQLAKDAPSAIDSFGEKHAQEVAAGILNLLPDQELIATTSSS